MTCGATHESGVRCDLPTGQHPVHTGLVPGSIPPRGVDWPNEEYIAPLKHRSKGQREQHKAMLRAAVAQDPLDAMVAHWEATKTQWLADAKRTLHEFCRGRVEPFTTPQDVWPLLDAPGEMRAFTVVVQHALRRRWITEVGSRRLRGGFTTRDGRAFEMNKLVPVYSSRIAMLPDDQNSVR